jgi:DnaJ-class molecular chaperone
MLWKLRRENKMSKEIEEAVYKMMNKHAGTIVKHLTNMYDTLNCPKCNGEGFLIIEDIEYVIKECPVCKGEGIYNVE